jgi:hypothetical protein
MPCRLDESDVAHRDSRRGPTVRYYSALLLSNSHDESDVAHRDSRRGPTVRYYSALLLSNSHELHVNHPVLITHITLHYITCLSLHYITLHNTTTSSNHHKGVPLLDHTCKLSDFCVGYGGGGVGRSSPYTTK